MGFGISKYIIIDAVVDWKLLYQAMRKSIKQPEKIPSNVHIVYCRLCLSCFMASDIDEYIILCLKSGLSQLLQMSEEL